MRRVIYVSGTRADYGLMSSTLKQLQSCSEIDLRICVTGMHLMHECGDTIKEIELDDLDVCGHVPVQLDSTSGLSMAKAMSVQLSGMLDIFVKKKPDIVLILGDRGEMLAAALAAIHLNIPIAHIHGGERSGSVDEPVRHAISKLSHYHFAATDAARERLIRMGELAENIYVTGAPGLDGLCELASKSKHELCADVGFDVEKPIALLVFHPVVQDAFNSGKQTEILLAAIKQTKIQTICLMPNSDAGGQGIRAVLETYRDNKDIALFTHLPRYVFVSWMKAADVMLGNSSSGIIEAASFALPVVNVGQRQHGREHGPNVKSVAIDQEEIMNLIEDALSIGKNLTQNTYGDGAAGERILELLMTLPLNEQLLNKYNAY